MEKEKPDAIGEHYVSNAEFSAALVEYLNRRREDLEAGRPEPQIPEYIGKCFMKIATGLSRRPNFKGYTYRDQMVSDAILNCVKAVGNFKPEKVTRSGKINAFAYFTQICWYAFLRRIGIEKEQQEIRVSLIDQADASEFMTDSSDGGESMSGYENGFVNAMKNRVDAQMGEQRKRGRKPKKTNALPKELEMFMQ